jgi:hypothetical protein
MAVVIDIVYAPFLGAQPEDNNIVNSVKKTSNSAYLMPKITTTKEANINQRSVILGYYTLKPSLSASTNVTDAYDSTNTFPKTDKIVFVRVDVQKKRESDTSYSTVHTYFCRHDEYRRLTAPIFNKDIHNYVGTEQIRVSDVVDGETIFVPEQLRADGTTIPAHYKWEGTSIVDKLMEFVNANIDLQYKMGRINSDSFAQVYSASLQSAITAGIQFVIQKRQAESVIEKAESATEMQARQATAFTENNIIKFIEQMSNVSTIAASTDAQELSQGFVPTIFGQIGTGAAGENITYGRDERYTEILTQLMGQLNIKINT